MTDTVILRWLCVVEKQEKLEADSLKDIESYKRQVTRHELIHAFLFESGIGYECEWACEEMVDWMARQFPKIVKGYIRDRKCRAV